MLRPFITTIALVCGIGLSAEDKITYEDHVLPIFEQACTNCHNPDKKKGGLDLSSYLGTMAGGSGGAAVTAGEGADSRLFLTSSHSMEPFMPPEGEKLSSKQLSIIRSWIDGGVLETVNSKVKKAPQNKIEFSASSTGKPSGPAPMPVNVSTEPSAPPARSSALHALVSSPWAPLIALSGQDQVLLYHSEKLQLIGVLPFPKSGQPTAIAFHPSGRFLTAAGGVPGKNGITATWELSSGKLLKTIAKEYDSILSTSVRSDMQAIATGSPSKKLKTWNTADGGIEHSIKKHTDWVTAVSYSPDGVLLASGDRNGGLWVWEAHSGMQLHNLRGHQGSISSLKWSADSNYLASASADGSLRFWNMNTGKQLKKVDAHKGGVLSMDWAKDGHVVSSGRDHKIKHWNPNYSLKKELPLNQSLVTKVCFSHDAMRIISANYDGEIEVRDTAGYQVVGTLDATPPRLAARLKMAESQYQDAAKSYQAARDKHQAEEQIQSTLAQNKSQALNKIQQQSQQLQGNKQHLEKLKKQLDDNAKKINQLDRLVKEEEKKLRDQQRRVADADKKKKHNEHLMRQANRSKQAARNELIKHQKAQDSWSAQVKKTPDDTQVVAREKQSREQLSATKARLAKVESDHSDQASKLKSSQETWQQSKELADEYAKQLNQSKQSRHSIHQEKNRLLQDRKLANEAIKQTHISIAKLNKEVADLDKKLHAHKTTLAQTAKLQSTAKAELMPLEENVSRLKSEQARYHSTATPTN